MLALGGLLSLHFTNIYFVADLALGSQTIEVRRKTSLRSPRVQEERQICSGIPAVKGESAQETSSVYVSRETQVTTLGYGWAQG